ncbi:MAG: dephospho-CoA kinase [Bdellovibrionaceae bacterium]|nr:dephospho-CoA kinase [Pseudobdellovibrionaceae bacterium]
MKWIALTGGIGTGKTTVAKLIQSLGVPVVDADQIAREVLEKGQPAYDEVVRHFGRGILLPDGRVDRRNLGRIVFQNSSELNVLENIVHPRVQEKVKKIREELKASGHPLAFYDVPLLFEKGIFGFDAVVCVVTSPQVQKERLRARGGLSDAEIEERISSQLPLHEKASRSDYVIDNDKDLASLKVQVAQLVQRLRQTQV